MRTLFLVLLLAAAASLTAQPDQGYMIFQTEGTVTLVHAGASKLKPDGLRFVAGDQLTVRKGWATFLDRDLKRVTVKEDADLSFEEVEGLFKKATASLENKYLVMMWEQMNAHESHTSVKGGVVRASGMLFFPFDSAVLLTDNVTFRFFNPERDELRLLIKDSRHVVLHSITLSDSLFRAEAVLSRLERNQVYFWTIHDGKTADNPDFMFFLPSLEGLMEINVTIETMRSSLLDIPEPERTALLDGIIRMNRWLL